MLTWVAPPLADLGGVRNAQPQLCGRSVNQKTVLWGDGEVVAQDRPPLNLDAKLQIHAQSSKHGSKGPCQNPPSQKDSKTGALRTPASKKSPSPKRSKGVGTLSPAGAQIAVLVQQRSKELLQLQARYQQISSVLARSDLDPELFAQQEELKDEINRVMAELASLDEQRPLVHPSNAITITNDSLLFVHVLVPHKACGPDLHPHHWYNTFVLFPDQ